MPPLDIDERPLLSVGIPTWNRSRFLKEMVLSVTTQAEQHGLADAVEIVVSDNASTDDTRGVVSGLQQQTSVPIRYHRNDTNLGAISNVLNTIKLSTGQYWMLYGDDDIMAEDALPLIVRVIREHTDAPVFMFEQTSAANRQLDTSSSVALSMVAVARRFFYYIGNAGVFALRTEDAQANLLKWGVERFQTSWPQTQLAFAIMSASDLPRPVIGVPVASSSSPHHGENTLYTSWYIWQTQLFALYRAALELRPIAGQPFFKAACAHIFSPRRALRIARDVALYTTFYDLPQDVAQTRRATWQSLRYATSKTLLPLLLMWLVTVLPRWTKAPGLLGIMLLRRPGQTLTRFGQMREAIREHKRRRLDASTHKDAKPRVYTPGDL